MDLPCQAYDVTTDRALQQVATILLNSRPKIQKWISDAESDDPESLGMFILLVRETCLITFPLDTYLQTNDQINSVLSRYDAFKRGETPPASIPAEFLPGKNEGLSLIDFDDATPGSGSGAGSSGKPADDLAGLFESATSLTSVPVTQPPIAAPSIGLGTSAPSSRPQSQFGQIKLPSTPPLHNQLQASGPVGSPGIIPSLVPARASPSSNLAATSIPQQPLVPQATSVPPISQGSTPQGKDPFADLAGLF